jgi:hypothetical protein
MHHCYSPSNNSNRATSYKDQKDYNNNIDLGTVGVVVSSGVVKAKNPKKVLIEFVKSIK